jgi:hypothetical protein
MEIADRPKLVLDPAGFYPLLEFRQNVEGEVVFRHGLIRSLACQHSALDGQMDSL